MISMSLFYVQAYWEVYSDLCVKVKAKHPYSEGRRLLDVLDMAVFDFLTGQSPLGSRVSHHWGHGSVITGVTGQSSLGSRVSHHWGHGSMNTGVKGQSSLGSRVSHHWGQESVITGVKGQSSLGSRVSGDKGQYVS